MKKMTAAVLFAAMALSTTAYAGNLAQEGVLGSKHDMTRAGGYRMDDFGRVCIYCHTPHNAIVNQGDNAPLWNRADTNNAQLTAYVWSAPANIGLATDPTVGPSRLCLSCHDGVTAVSSHGPTAGTAQGLHGATFQDHIDQASGRAWLDLEGTHPIGFKYSDAFAKRGVNELVDLSTNPTFISTVGNATTFDTKNRTAGAGTTSTNKKISDTLYDGYVTCASCHDVHNTNNAVNTFTANNPTFVPNYFVWAPEKDSALCISCHVK